MVEKITTQLTYDEYKRTMTGKMLDVTEMAEPIVDIWSYVQHLVTDNVVLEYVYNNQLVEAVYRNDKSTFDHVLLPTDKPNAFVAIIVDLEQREVKGHFRLDLNKEYGL